MRSYLTDFNEISQAAVERDRAQVFDDLNNEISGLSVGRISRHLGDENVNAIAIGKRGKDGDSAYEFALLSTTSFSQLYDQAWSGLRYTEAATERALERAEQALADNAGAFDTILGRAATLEDGTRVFRHDDGQVWNEHREQVDPALAATIEWQGHEPSYETFLIRSDAVAEAQERIDVIRSYQVTLGEHRETIQDKDNVTRDQLEDMIESMSAEMPTEVRAEMPDSSMGREPVSDTSFVPDATLPGLSN